MKKILDTLYSTRLMAVLFFVFAIAMGIATFIENDYGTQTSKALVYNTWWFEAIMVFFVINFFGNIFRYRLHKKEKWPVLMFHLSFIFILLGAGVTRYIGYEGIMLINEGETTNKFLSETTYLNVVVDDNKQQKIYFPKVLLSAWGKNTWSYNSEFKGKDFSIKLREYIPWAKEEFVEDENGIEHLFVVESSSGSRHEHYIEKGTIQNIHGILVGYDVPNNNANINIKSVNDTLRILTKNDGDFQIMATQQKGIVKKDSLQAFNLRALYKVAGLPFVVPQPPVKGAKQTVRGPKDNKKFDQLVLDVTVGGETKSIDVVGGKFNSEGTKELTVGNLNFRMLYGSRILETPFNVKLNDFQLEKYPGSESAASYASEVTVIDPKETFDYRIYMNHILDHKGYKFFQSSYDLSGPVEQTHLSVNHDFWGTLITYIGYSFLYFGLICIFFAKHTRFDFLKKNLVKIRKKKAALSLITFLTLGGLVSAQEHNSHTTHTMTEQQIDSILEANIVDLEHAEAFNKLVVQDVGGRMKPLHTFSSELLRKVSKSETFKGMEPSQVVLSILENPKFWFEVPIIYLERGNTQVREILGIDKDAQYARLSDFFTPTGASKIGPYVEEAQKEKIQSKFQKDVIKIDRRVGLLYQAIGGSIFRFYPVPGDENNTWVSRLEAPRANITGKDSVFVRDAFPIYQRILYNAKRTKDYSSANETLGYLIGFQKKYGAAVYPSEEKIDLEIRYNKARIFVQLSKYYGLVSVFLIIFVIMQIFFDKKALNYLIKGLIGIIVLLFALHIAGLGSRWYISGNAPWSNAYESIIYVAFAVMLFGLYVGRKSALTIGAAAFLTATILAFAHQNWLDPEIANLQPVLNSWWLLVHVSIIVASYGPFALAMILGIVSLLLMIFTTAKNKQKMDLNIKELTIINEMAMTIGLVMLTIGNFLGGMWANESWGRYWGWDPKETWALISIMIYAFVLHMRLVSGLRGKYTYNLWSIIAFASIMMTYFGVNFYLSGLHSYASGDKVITPNSVFYSIGFVLILGVFAWFKHKKYYKN
ncbi:cytochrome c biogenesis protein CcsA [Flavobacteriaceae bacterium S356]|uniref:Cytochrome c biogenesis protein CcsA n=1 Tax=Asprobacillus argus TaxID=3076534 RepID=A0ABU3LK15_9FLAO|nr:cytochrome c biogenesis protein CcsA [Flavobacteriaceae bacterium S356]